MVAGLLDGPRARRAFLLRCTLDPPWALRIVDEAPLSLVAILRGSAWFVPAAGQPMERVPRDGPLVRGPDHHTFCRDATTLAQVSSPLHLPCSPPVVQ